MKEKVKVKSKKAKVKSEAEAFLHFRLFTFALKRSVSSIIPYVLVLSLVVPYTSYFNVSAQSVPGDRSGSHSGRRESFTRAEREMVESAMGAVCFERENDPQSSVPIDEMQARPSLPAGHPEAVAGAHRAQRLLPVARELTIAALRQLASENKISAARLRGAITRIYAVKTIRPDMDSRDNASVRLREPHTINFGTIFLASLRSDEGMVSVLAHELTHIADGKEDVLHPLFRLIGQRAAARTGLRIAGQRAEELTCDLVGAIAARAFIVRVPNREPLARRLARSVEHNCVEEDETDDDHLSPRNTMRALFSLDPVLARDLIGERNITAPPARTPTSIRTRRTSLTIARPRSYHQLFHR